MQPARSPAVHVSLDNPGAVAVLLQGLRTGDQVRILLARDPDHPHVDLSDAGGVAELLRESLDSPVRRHASRDLTDHSMTANR